MHESLKKPKRAKRARSSSLALRSRPGSRGDSDGLPAVRADRDNRRRNSHLLSEELNIVPGIEGKLRPLANASEVFGPAGQGLVDRPAEVEIGQRGGEVGCPLAILLVSDGDLQLGETAEDVQEHDRDLGRPAHPRRVADSDGVEPAAPPGPPGDGPILAADLADALARRIVLLGGEGPASDAGR